MKKYFVIPVALLAFILFSGKSCVDNSGGKNGRLEQDSTIAKQMQDIRSQFAIEYPGDETLRAFEQKAIQKLMDFADYSRIANDTSLDSVFRSQAASLLSGLFYHGEVQQIQETHESIISFDEARVTNPLRRTNDSAFTGDIEFTMKVARAAKGDTNVIETYLDSIRIIAVKTSRETGADILKIWKVFLLSNRRNI